MENQQNYYFLEIPLDDPDKIMQNLSGLGLKEELENGPSWLRAYLEQSIKNKMVEEIFLVNNNTIWQWDETVHENYQSDPQFTAGLLKQLGIPQDVHIPVLRLTDETLEPVPDRDFYAVYPDGEAPQVIRDLTKLGLLHPTNTEGQWLTEDSIRHRDDELLYISANRVLSPGQYQGKDLAKTPVYMLDDLLKLQHVKDIAGVMDRNKSENYFRSIPFERRTMEVCVAAVRTFAGNIKQIGSLPENDVLHKAHIDKISPLFSLAKDIRPWAIGTELFLRLAALDERCVALPDYENLSKYGIGITRKDYDYIRSVSFDNSGIQRFKDIPHQERNYLISSAAVQAYGRNLREVPGDLKTPSLIMTALENDGMALEFVQAEKMTAQMLYSAIKNSHGQAIMFVPGEARTRELGLAAMEQALCNPDRDRKLTGKILEAIPDATVKLEALNMLWQSNINRYKDFYNRVFDSEKKGELLPGLDKQQMDDIVLISTYPLSFIPEERFTKLLCDMAILGNGDNIRSVPENLRDDEIVTSSLCKYGDALQHLPEEKRTYENCLAAAGSDQFALYFIPEKYLTHDLCRITVQTGAGMYEEFQNPDSIAVLEKIPYPDIVKEGIALLDPHLNRNELLDIISENPRCMQFIPDRFKTKFFYNQAVNVNGWALEYVPGEMKTKQMCRAAKDASPDLGYGHLAIVSFVPYADVALEYLKEAQSNIDVHEVFMSIPEEARDEKLIAEAVKMDLNCFHFLDDARKTRELCLMAVRLGGAQGNIFNYIPEKMWDRDFCMQAFETNPAVIAKIPAGMRTPDICLRAVLDNPDNKIYVPAEIAGGKNIYSFNNRLEKLLVEPRQLKYEDVNTLYRGGSIRIPQIKNKAGVLTDKQITYNKDLDSIICRGEKTAVRPAQPQPDQRRQKGRTL